MITPQLLEYVRQQTAQNIPRESIRSALIANNWTISDVDEALAMTIPQNTVPPIPQPVQQFTSPMQSTQMAPPVQSAAPLQAAQPLQPVQTVSATAPHTNRPLILASVILLLILGAGGAYAAIKLSAPAAPTVTEVAPSALPIASSTESGTAVATTSTATQTPVTTSGSATKDCGTFDGAARLFQGTLTAADKTILACINGSIIACSPASVKLVGTGVTTLRIIGKEGGTCVAENKVIQKSTQPQSWEYYETCKFPIDTFITPLVNSLQKAGSTYGLFLGLAFMKTVDDAQPDSSGWYTSELTTSDNVRVSFKCR